MNQCGMAPHYDLVQEMANILLSKCSGQAASKEFDVESLILGIHEWSRH
jgi:hypothetical protein